MLRLPVFWRLGLLLLVVGQVAVLFLLSRLAARYAQPAASEKAVQPRLVLRGAGLAVALRPPTKDRSLRWSEIELATGGKCGRLKLSSHLFAITAGRQTFTSFDCTMTELETDGTSVSAKFVCPKDVLIAWQVRVQPDWHFGRVLVELSSANDSGAPTSVNELRLIEVPTAHGCGVSRPTGDVDGSPVVVDGHLFLGVEHPLGVHEPIESATSRLLGGGSGIRATVAHLARRRWPPRPGTPWRYSAAFGVFADPSQARRSFLAYLDQVKPPKRWRRQMLHYNSWYDMHSWQDDEFYRHYPFLNDLQKDVMTEASCLRRVKHFSQELVLKRGVPMDSFLWDDGWDDPRTLWDFDRTRFPQGFSAVAEAARNYSTGIGVWLSPWGGYGMAQQERLRLGLTQGFETNAGGFSLAGPRYFARFRDAALTMRRLFRTNLYKFDGVAGDPEELAEEMESMLALISDLREGSAAATVAGINVTSAEGGHAEQTSKSGASSDDEADPWINLTTGTWPSPYFLLWADSIWRGGGDLGLFRSPELEQLSRRQRWILWRELLVCRNVAEKAEFFPLSQLMIHGVVVGFHGEALLRGLDEHTSLDLAQEVWSFVGMGLRLQELYISPQLLQPQDWDTLAEALKWSHQNLDVLSDSHWILGRFRNFEPYGVASWRASRDRPSMGFIMLRNPLPKPQAARQFTLAEVLELPTSYLSASFEVTIVKSLSDGAEREGCALLLAAGVAGHQGLDCAVQASSLLSAQLRPAEVLVLEVRQTPAR